MKCPTYGVRSAGDVQRGKIGEPACGNIVYACLRGFAKALDFELVYSLLVFEQPEPRTNHFAGVAETAIPYIVLNELFEVWREVDVLGWHYFTLLNWQKLST